MGKRLIALSLTCILFLAGCSNTAGQPSAQPEPTPTPSTQPAAADFTLPYQPNASLHPITGTNKTNLAFSSLVYQGLFELDNTFTPHGVLCSGQSSDASGLIWTLSLAEAFFSDGSAVTADDVVRSLTAARSSELYAPRFRDVQSIAATDISTVTITLSRPNSALPALLDIPIIRDSSDGSMPLGSGPYRFVENDGPLHLLRNPSAPENVPEKIFLYPVTAADKLIYAFDAGEVSMVVSDLTGANALGYSSGYETFDYPTTTMLYVGFQTSWGVCSNAMIRRALSFCFDRETVSDSLLAGHADPTCLPFSPRCALHSETYEQQESYDPDIAAQLLSDAGYDAGEDGLLYRYGSPLSITFIVNTDNPFKVTIAEYLADELTQLGIAVELKKLSWDDYMYALNYGLFDLYLGEVALTADFDLTPLLEPNGGLNYGRYSNPETSGLLNTLRACSKEELSSAVDAFSAQFAVDCPLAPLCFKEHSVLTQWQTLSGLNPTRQNPFYQLKSLRFRA